MSDAEVKNNAGEEATAEELKAAKRPAEDTESDPKKQKTENGTHAEEDVAGEDDEDVEEEEDIGEEDEEDLEEGDEEDEGAGDEEDEEEGEEEAEAEEDGE